MEKKNGPHRNIERAEGDQKGGDVRTNTELKHLCEAARKKGNERVGECNGQSNMRTVDTTDILQR